VARAIVERNTRQKRAIRQALQGAGRPLSTEEVFAAAQREIDGLGIATVYRSIRSLLDDGWLAPVEVPGKGTLYELAGKGHHHHFSCTSCHRVYELDGCDSGVSVRLPKGFRATRHEVTIYGVCAACPPAKANANANANRSDSRKSSL
jgi:Fur family ferric uptake transcriptional regulator